MKIYPSGRWNIIDDPEYLDWLNMLVVPGSSMGGTRPKASVLDLIGNLWIAKFLNKNEDIRAWKMVTYEMAINTGIDMAESHAANFHVTDTRF